MTESQKFLLSKLIVSPDAVATGSGEHTDKKTGNVYKPIQNPTTAKPGGAQEFLFNHLAVAPDTVLAPKALSTPKPSTPKYNFMTQQFDGPVKPPEGIERFLHFDAIIKAQEAQKKAAQEQEKIDLQTNLAEKQDRMYKKQAETLASQIAQLDQQLVGLSRGGMYSDVGEIKRQKEEERAFLQKQLDFYESKLPKPAPITIGSILKPIGKGVSDVGYAVGSFAVTSPLNPASGAFELAKELSGGVFDVKKEYDKVFLPAKTNWTNLVQEERDKRGKGYGVLATVAEGIGSAIPNAALAIMSGGTSLAATLPATTGFSATVSAGLTQIINSPMFGLTFAQNAGSAYDTAIANGATKEEAQLASTLIGLLNTGVELSGGMETLPAALKSGSTSAKVEYVLSTLHEGGEEGIQGLIERLTNKLVYDKDAPWFSTTDPTAIFNPSVMNEEIGVGTAVGALLNGGQVLASSLPNIVPNTQPQKQTATAPQITPPVAPQQPAAPAQQQAAIQPQQSSPVMAQPQSTAPTTPSTTQPTMPQGMGAIQQETPTAPPTVQQTAPTANNTKAVVPENKPVIFDTPQTPSTPEVNTHSSDTPLLKQPSSDIAVDDASFKAAENKLNLYKGVAAINDSPKDLGVVLKAELGEAYNTPKKTTIADVSTNGKAYTVTVDKTPILDFINSVNDISADVTPGTLYILASLPDVVRAAKLTGVGTLTGQTLSGTAYTIPTADFRSTVTAGGEQYIVSFKVTESPTSGNAVHSVDVVRVLKPEFNAQYDRYVTANGSGGPTGTSPSLESGGGEGYNGSGERFVDGSNGKDAEGGPSAVGAGDKGVNYSRPSGYRTGVRDKVWKNAIEDDGEVRNKDDPWQMGHKPGYEFRKHQQSAMKRGISREEFLDEHNNPYHYRPELPGSNLSHKGEDMTEQYFGP